MIQINGNYFSEMYTLTGMDSVLYELIEHPMNNIIKPSDKVLYYSRFSGILPCQVLEIGKKKIQVYIDLYDKKIWVSPEKVTLPPTGNS